jgi:phospholipid transport system substrate-binding protein
MSWLVHLRIVLIALPTLTAHGPAKASPASDLVARFVETAAIAEPGQDERLLQRLREFFDMDSMALSALGEMSATVSGQLRTRYVASQNRLLVRVIKRHLGAVRPSALKVVGTRRLDDAKELVVTRVRLDDGREKEVMWYVGVKGAPRIVDLAYDGLLVSEMQRREFANIVHVNSGDLNALPDAIDRLNP